MDHDEPTGALVRAFLDDGAVRLLLVEATAPAEHTRQTHGLGPDAARLGAEAVVAAALNAAYVKGDEQLTFRVEGEAPRCAVYADVTAEGALRARVEPPDLALPDGRLQGFLIAIKSLGARELYRGVTAVPGTTLEAALAEHLDTSTQVQDVLRIGVRQGPDGGIQQAGGLLLERMPDERGHPSLEPEAFRTRYAWVGKADVFQLLTQLAFGSLGDRPLTVLESRPLVWRCRCSPERIRDVLGSLPATELQEMIHEDQGAEVTCNFCGRAYQFEEDALRDILEAQDPAR